MRNDTHIVVVTGNLGTEPEMRYLPSGVAVTNFSLAVNRTYKNAASEQQEAVTWFRVAAWDKLGELCNQYLTKGRRVLVQGTVTASAYLAQDGTARASLELRAEKVTFLDNGTKDAPAVEVGEEEIPF